MERRMLLAVVLSFVAVTAWSMLTAKPPTKGDSQGTTDGGTEEPGPDGQPAAQPGVPPADVGGAQPTPPAQPGVAEPAPAPAPSDDTPQPNGDVEASSVVLEAPELTVTFTSLGAGIERIRLKHAYEADGKNPIDIVVPAEPALLMGQTDDTQLRPTVAPGGAGRKDAPAGPMRRLHWRLDPAAAEATPENDVVFTFETTEGIRWTKRWIMPSEPKRYDVRLALSAQRFGGQGAGEQGKEKASLKLLASSGRFREIFRGAFGTPDTVVTMHANDPEIREGGELIFGAPINEIALEGIPNHLRMLGTRSTYFLTAFYTDTENGVVAPVSAYWATGEQADKRGTMEATIKDWYATTYDRKAEADRDLAERIQKGVKQILHAWMVVDVPVAAAGKQAEAVELRLYAGPIDRETLQQDEYGALDPMLTYPTAPDFVAKILLWIYDFWRKLFGSEGLGIILMTLCVRGGLMPLSIRNQLSMRRYSRKVAKLKPKLKQLQERFAKNPKKQREEQMKLYREHGVGFPGGCVMMLIQIPIFFSLFSALRVEYTIRGAEFLWIKDLAGPDRLVDFGRTLFDLGFFKFDAINLLPILMVALSIWHTRSMPKPADEQQAQQMKMMKWMPIFFAFILYNYTAALALYMVLSSAFALVESKIVRAKDEAEVAALEASAPA